MVSDNYTNDAPFESFLAVETFQILYIPICFVTTTIVAIHHLMITKFKNKN